MNKDNVGVGAIDAGRYQQIERSMAGGRIAPPPEAIQMEPGKELQEKWSGKGGYPMPENAADFRGRTSARIAQRKIFDTLSEKMDFALIDAGEAFE